MARTMLKEQVEFTALNILDEYLKKVADWEALTKKEITKMEHEHQEAAKPTLRMVCSATMHYLPQDDRQAVREELVKKISEDSGLTKVCLLDSL